MKSLILLPDGVGIRNFLCTRFVEHLLAEGDVLIWHALSPLCIAEHQSRLGDRVQWEPLPAHREPRLAQVLRLAKTAAQLRWRRRNGHALPSIERTRRAGGWRSRALRRTARGLGALFGTQRGAVLLHRAHGFAVSHSPGLAPFTEYLRRHSPDVVFCTHQRASSALPAMAAARRLGIPTATFIYSWDNLPKDRMAVHADGFLVWSQYMKDELLECYPEVRPDDVYVVGTPQFEHYFNPALIEPREVFLQRLGLDPKRPTVCFSGDDVGTSPHDPQYLADLAESFRRLPGPGTPQILFRRCPVDISGRSGPTLERYPEVVASEPVWRYDDPGNWARVVPSTADVALLANVVHHCDAVVNVGSTMAMDFAILGKPSIYIAYDPPGITGPWSVGEIYSYPHFRTVHKLQPVYWARSAEELGPLVLHALEHPLEKDAARRAWVSLQVAQPMDKASERCAAALVHISKARRRG